MKRQKGNEGIERKSGYFRIYAWFWPKKKKAIKKELLMNSTSLNSETSVHQKISLGKCKYKADIIFATEVSTFAKHNRQETYIQNT